jgi:hypothetical protein
MTTPRPLTYLSWEDFEASDERRAVSREHDLGLRWRSARRGEPTFRLAWVEATDELIAVRHGTPPMGGRVSVLGRMGLDDVQRRLEGWEDVCGEPGSYEWLLARTAPHAKPVRGVPALPVAG